MNPIIRNILAVLVGVIVGGLINFGIVNISGSIIPLPEGVDPTDRESLMKAMPFYGPEQFIFPFLAHAIGTLAGAYTAARLAASHSKQLAYVIGGVFFMGGIAATIMLPAPVWFSALDLIAAYFPMAWLGYQLVPRKVN